MRSGLHASISHIVVLLWSFREIEPLCSALGLPIRDKNLSDSRATSIQGKREIFKQERTVSLLSGRAGRQTSPVFVKFTVSGVDGVRAGRLWLKTKER